jgi:MFS family permease
MNSSARWKPASECTADTSRASCKPRSGSSPVRHSGTGLAWAMAVAFALQTVRGIGIAAVDVAVTTLLQRAVPPRMLGRVFGNVYGAVGLAAGLSYVLGGWRSTSHPRGSSSWSPAPAGCWSPAPWPSRWFSKPGRTAKARTRVLVDSLRCPASAASRCPQTLSAYC